jgi:hypothetical protein
MSCSCHKMMLRCTFGVRLGVVFVIICRMYYTGTLLMKKLFRLRSLHIHIYGTVPTATRSATPQKMLLKLWSTSLTSNPMTHTITSFFWIISCLKRVCSSLDGCSCAFADADRHKVSSIIHFHIPVLVWLSSELWLFSDMLGQEASMSCLNLMFLVMVHPGT